MILAVDPALLSGCGSNSGLRRKSSSSAGRLWQEPSTTNAQRAGVRPPHWKSTLRAHQISRVRKRGKPSAMQLRTEAHSSIMVVPNFERAFDLDSYTIWFFLSKNHELRTECGKVQFRHFLIELCRQEEDIVFVGLKPARSRRLQQSRRNALLKLVVVVVDFHAFQALRVRQVDLVVKVQVFRTKALFLIFFTVQNDDMCTTPSVNADVGDAM